MPIRDQNGIVIASMSVQYEITDIKLALKALQDSHDRYEYVTKATFDAIWDLNLEKMKVLLGAAGVWLTIVFSAVVMLGYAAYHFISKFW